MDREFEKFAGGPNEAIAKRIHVTITPAKLIRLNRNMYEQMGKPSAVHLGYSRTRDVIAIEEASPRLSDSFPVLPNRCAWRINAAPFCRHFGISIDTTLKFIRPDLEGNTLLLNLRETISVGSRKRRKK
ncbi:MAG: hypothetical protein ABI878_11035 [Acidobacteriota bacterium]